MTTNITLSLDKRRAKKDNSFPIILRLSHRRKTLSIQTGYSVIENDWNDKSRSIKKTCKSVGSVSRLNNLLQKKKTDAIDTISKLDDQGILPKLTIKEIKDKIVGQNNETDFFGFTQSLIADMREKGQQGNARTYDFVSKALKKYVKADLKFHEINYDFLMKYERSFIGKGNSYNGLSVYMRTIRAIYNKAIKAGVAEKELFPFGNYKIKNRPTEKRAISVEALKAIFEADVSHSSKLQLAQDLFRLSFYLMGMNFSDLATLKMKDIVDGRMKYERAKTHHRFDMALNPEAIETLKKYDHGQGKEDYVFPIVTKAKDNEVYDQISWARSRHNKALKEIAKIARVETNLTSYVSRHSFASLAKNKGIPVAAISEMLGHKSIKTTQIYLNSLSNEQLDSYQQEITRL